MRHTPHWPWAALGCLTALVVTAWFPLGEPADLIALTTGDQLMQPSTVETPRSTGERASSVPTADNTNLALSVSPAGLTAGDAKDEADVQIEIEVGLDELFGYEQTEPIGNGDTRTGTTASADDRNTNGDEAADPSSDSNISNAAPRLLAVYPRRQPQPVPGTSEATDVNDVANPASSLGSSTSTPPTAFASSPTPIQPSPIPQTAASAPDSSDAPTASSESTVDSSPPVLETQQALVLELDTSDSSPPDVVAHAWFDPSTDHDVLNPMLWVRFYTPTDSILQRARDLWSGVPDDRRVLMLFMDAHVHRDSVDQPLATTVTDGLDFSAYRQRWEELLDRLAAEGLIPGRVVLDYEGGFSTFHLRQQHGSAEATRQQLISVWANPQAFAALPAELQALDPAEHSWAWNGSREAITAWNGFAAEKVAASLRTDIAEPLHARFPDTPITNFNDIDYAETQFDRHGWPIPRSQVGAETSPVLYRGTVEEILERVRQARDATNRMPVPWVAYPSFINGREQFAQIVQGAYGLGVREFLLWNPEQPGKDPGDDSFVAEVFQALNQQAAASYD